MRGKPFVVLCAGAIFAAIGADAALAQGGGQASALVEEIKAAPKAGVDFMDFVYPGQNVDLGVRGELVLSYFANCREETIRGGTVTIGEKQSSVQGGRVAARTRSCDSRKFAATTQTAEAGAAVKRLTPFDAKAWAEAALKSRHPIFRWDGEGVVTVRVLETEAAPPRVVWTGTTSKNWIAYPARAARLKTGLPYEVEVTGGTIGTAHANFSIDPGLEIADTVSNRTVPLRR
jgi:hypothetical protein